MNIPNNSYNTKEISIYLNHSFYSKSSIIKTLYWYSDRFIFQFNTKNEYFHLILNPIEELELEEMEKLFHLLNRDFLDFQLRQVIHEETKNIRDLITAKAFSNGQLDEIPNGDISDPVGFITK